MNRNIGDSDIAADCTAKGGTNACAPVACRSRQHVRRAASLDGESCSAGDGDARVVGGGYGVALAPYMDSGAAALYVDGITARHAYLCIFQVDFRIAVRHLDTVAACTGNIVSTIIGNLMSAGQRGEVDGLRTLSVCRNRDSVDFASLQGYGIVYVEVASDTGFRHNIEPLYASRRQADFPAGAYALVFSFI